MNPPAVAAALLGLALLLACLRLRSRTAALAEAREGLRALSRRSEETVAQLAAEKAQLDATLSHMVEGVAAVDSEGRVLEINPAMERLFGVARAQVLGKPFLEALRHNPLHDLAAEALSKRSPRSGELALFTPEERVFETHANPIMEGETLRGAVLVLHDITRLRQLERVRREFVANVSHELRTPLASIKGFAETLKRGAIEDSRHRLEFVETIERHADRLTHLVDELLALAALESGKERLSREPVPLAELVLEIIRSLAPQAKRRKVRVSSSAAPELQALGDRGKLSQVLTNLIENAIKFNREGGEVRVAALRDGEGLRVSVSDTGMGIPEADLPRVFERFYRVDKARSRELGGTGLGLSIVKHVVELHGGRVWAESSEGEGSTFHFTVPSA